MLLVYFDEAKPDLPDSPYFWLGGLAVTPEVAPALEKEITALAVECFGEGASLTKECEFHASAIANRTGPFKGLTDPAKRFEILKRLVSIYAKKDGVFRLTARIDTEKLYSGTSAEDFALIFFIEKVNELAKAQKTVALLIGDLEHEKTVNRSVQNVHKYRQTKTPYDFGKTIDSVIDTVHFAHSHHSRLLQLADVFVWTRQMMHRKGELKELRADLAKFVRESADTHWDHKYKQWPP